MTTPQKVQLFFKEVWVEMRRVSWLSRNDVIKYTLTVLGVTIGAAIFLGGLDYIFTEIIKRIILR